MIAPDTPPWTAASVRGTGQGLGSLHPSTNREEVELGLLLEAIYRYYGLDFRHYAMASLRRRVWNTVRAEGLVSVSGLAERGLHDQECMERLLLQLSVNVTALFRDPSFYVSFRAKALPMLATHPFIRIWHAGCSTGEEVYSMAILLHEAGLLERCRIYATDMNEAVLARAQEGIYAADLLPEYAANYLKAGGQAQLGDYYTASYDHILFRKALRRHVVFSHHNLVTDSSFNEFNVVFCRNVMIYFDATLQERVHHLIYDSLRHFGVLALGARESLKGSPHERDYATLDAEEKIFRRRP